MSQQKQPPGARPKAQRGSAPKGGGGGQVRQKSSGKAAPNRQRKQRPQPHGDDAVATTLARNIYLRDRHYFLYRVIMALSVALVCSIVGLVAIALTTETEYRYFATYEDGRVKELTPLGRPVQSQSDLKTWVSRAVTTAYTFDFANYRQQFSRAQKFFTPTGWDGFVNALRQSGNLQAVIDNKLVTSAVPKKAPIIVAQGRVQGRYAWKVQMPILLTYKSANDTTAQDVMATVTVVRVPETQNPKGVGIAQIIAE